MNSLFKSFLLIIFSIPFQGQSILTAQKTVVVDILVQGNEKTKGFAILRSCGLEAGDTLEVSELEYQKQRIHDNVYNMEIFNDVVVLDSVVNEGIIFIINVKERWYVIPIPYVSFEERTFGEWWEDKDADRLVYGLGMEWKNISGRGEKLYAYIQNGYSRKISATLFKPFLFPKQKLNGTFGYYYKNLKEIGYGTENGYLQFMRLGNERMQVSHEGRFSIGKRFTVRKTLEIGAEFFWFKPHDSIVHYNDTYVSQEDNTEYYPSLFIWYKNDQRDLTTYPMKGYKFEFYARHSGMPGISTTHFFKTYGQFSHHIPIGGDRVNFSYGLYSLLSLGSQIPYYDKHFLGFEYRVRGYEQYVIDGSFINLAKTEFKFGIIPRRILHVAEMPFRRFRDFPLGLYLTLFGDAGYVMDNTFNDHDPTHKDKLLLGYGAGLNLITFYDIVLRAEYAFNTLGQSGFYLNATISIR